MELSKEERIKLWAEVKKKTNLNRKEFAEKYNFPWGSVHNWTRSGVAPVYVERVQQILKEEPTTVRNSNPVGRPKGRKNKTHKTYNIEALVQPVTNSKKLCLVIGDVDSLKNLMRELWN